MKAGILGFVIAAIASPCFAEQWVHTPLIGVEPARTFSAFELKDIKPDATGKVAITVVDYFETAQSDGAVTVYNDLSINCARKTVATTWITRYSDNGAQISYREIKSPVAKKIVADSKEDLFRAAFCDGARDRLRPFNFDPLRPVANVFFDLPR